MSDQKNPDEGATAAPPKRKRTLQSAEIRRLFSLRRGDNRRLCDEIEDMSVESQRCLLRILKDMDDEARRNERAARYARQLGFR